MLTQAEYLHWLAVAGRFTRKADETSDLLHNALIAAINAGRHDLTDTDNAAWFAGVIRKTALMEARSAGRRKKRDAGHQGFVSEEPTPPDELEAWLAVVSSLPPAARSVAILALHGLNRKEIASVLGLNDASLRQRLTTIRRSIDELEPPARPQQLPRPRSTLRTRLEVGILRRSLLAVLQHEGDLGIHDPDGHLIVLTKKGSHNQLPRQQC